MNEPPVHMSGLELQRQLKGFLAWPAIPDKSYVAGGPVYREVYEMAQNLKAQLRAGFDESDCVCLCTEDRAIFAAALLATLGGGPMLALPHSYASPALKALKAATGFTAAISEETRDLPAGVNRLTPAVDGPKAALGDAAADMGRQWLALFTGGSTAKPALWPKTVANIFGEALYLSRRFCVSADDRFVAAVPLYHIYGLLYSALVPLIASATVYPGTPAFPGEIVEALTCMPATVFVGVPLHYRMLAEETVQLPRLKTAFSSASVLNESDSRSFWRKTGAHVHEVYGSTETGGVGARCRQKGQAVFTPFDGVQWRIENGRLRVRSPYSSPLLKTDSKGFVEIGDRAKAAGAGFYLMGRADGVVKIGGIRVDLDAVKETIVAHSHVSDAVVVDSEVRSSRQREIAAVVAGTVSHQALKRYLADRLEAAAIPRRIVVVPRLPVKPTGKYDRKQLTRLLETKPRSGKETCP